MQVAHVLSAAPRPPLAMCVCAGVGYSLSGLVAQMREQDNQWQQGEVTVKLAKAYGYCWGVERAVRMAYEARNANPDKKLYITNEIIHNPEVNQVGCWGVRGYMGVMAAGSGRRRSSTAAVSQGPVEQLAAARVCSPHHTRHS